MSDVSKLSTEELLAIVNPRKQSTDVSSLSNEELLSIVKPSSSNSKSRLFEVGDKGVDAVSTLDDLKLGFADEYGKEKILKEKFSIVQKSPDGAWLVGNDIREMIPVNPDAIFSDLPGKFAQFTASIPSIAGQIVGEVVGAGVGAAAGGIGAVPGAIIGAGVGSGVGESVRAGIGKIAGLRKPEITKEDATDVAMSTVFGAAGTGVAQLMKGGAGLVSQQFSKLFDKGLKQKAVEQAVTLPSETIQGKGISKVFALLSGVPEQSTKDVLDLGVERTIANPVNLQPNRVVVLAESLANAVDNTTNDLGKNVAKQAEELVKGPIKQVKAKPFFDLMIKEAQSLDLVDDFGNINKNAVGKENIEYLKKVLGTFGYKVERDGVTRFVADESREIPLARLMKIQSQLGDKFDSLSPKFQSSVFNLLNSEDSVMPGIRTTIRNIAMKTGNAEFLDAVDKYATFSKLRESIKAIDKNNVVAAENLIRGLQNQPETIKTALRQIDSFSSEKFLDDMRAWRATQDFMKVKFDPFRFGFVAGTLGLFNGFESDQKKLANIAGAGLIATPFGARTLLRSSSALKNAIKISMEKATSVVPRGIKEKVGKLPVSGAASTQVLRGLLNR
jgi:hypothetical protein